MTEDRIAALVRATHEGEVLGEALFAELVAGEADADHRGKMHACQLLEAQTRARAEALAADLGVALGPIESHAETGRQAAGSLAAMSWAERMGAIAGGTAGYRSLYAELADAVPDHPVVTQLVQHEKAMNAFTTAEAAGDPDALTHLTAALDDEHRSLLDAARERS